MTSQVNFSFDYDYVKECWNLPRGSVPPQLKAQGVPHALWMHFWDYAQSVVERATVRSIMKDKLLGLAHAELLNANTTKRSSSNSRQQYAEMAKLEDQTNQDFECLQRQAERLFPNSSAKVSKDAKSGQKFGLEIRLLHATSPTSSSSNTETPMSTLHLHYDAHRSSWNQPRETLPSKLADQGVPLTDWIAIWDYGFGVNQRAKERENLNELHERELRLCQKSLSYMNTSSSSSSSTKNNKSVVNVPVTSSVDNNSTTANHIRMKMDKLRRAKEANVNNTKKGWQELQRRATQRFEPYGVKAYLSHQDNNQDECGLQLHCSTNDKPISTSPSSTAKGGRQSPPHHQHTKKVLPTSSIWMPSSAKSPRHHHHKAKEEETIPSVWTYIKEETKIRTSSHQPAILTSAATNNVLRPRNGNENAPPKPETVRLHKSKDKDSSSSVFDQQPPPVVLTYVHDEVPSKIEVTTPLSFDGPLDSFDEDSHGYAVPPAPSTPPSSIGSCSSGSSLGSFKATRPIVKSKKVVKRVRFGHNKLCEFDNPYTKSDKKLLWFTHEERDANRSKTKLLAQRVIDSRNNGGSHNVVFMDSDTEEEVCWRGLEHAQKGNLSHRQETRRAFMSKVLEKQRSLRLDAFTFRRGTPSNDPAGDLQQFVYRQSRHCRERAQKFAANDAKEARTVYKESLRKANLQGSSSSSSSSSIVSSSCGSQHSRLLQHQPHHHHLAHHEQSELYHKNDIFQDYCRQMHMASKARMQQAVV